MECGVDVVCVTLDAWSNELYASLQSPDGDVNADLESVLGRIDHFRQMRETHQKVKPIVVPEMTKMSDNVHELESFYDGWLGRSGAVTISGFSHCARQFEDRAVINMAPPSRFACRRIANRCLVLANGQVTTCDQDLAGRQIVGNLMESSLEEVWMGEAFQRIRNAHNHGDFDSLALCQSCDDWQ